ncbi:hypothetical protein [Halobacterium sp. R2-5]|uniref:hypothetical protein n=1 Tax=Halobacterium sp. R2-5 TaxID=2715751 RepID=UPI001421E9F6|nr:hypothetical protein [Halobacterium sp. R2-5]NIB99844.1 hypothetical protein [Halobacterium sp. R2-5]
MRRTLVAVALALLVSTAGCAAFGGGDTDTAPTDDVVEPSDPSADATGVTQSVRLSVDESTAGGEWTSLSVEYPRENFTVESAQHENVSLGVDTDDDGEVDEQFDETHISGVNNNAYSFRVELDTGYTLESGDVVVVEYPAVDNPAELGNYTVEATLNDEQTANGTITVE